MKEKGGKGRELSLEYLMGIYRDIEVFLDELEKKVKLV